MKVEVVIVDDCTFTYEEEDGNMLPYRGDIVILEDKRYEVIGRIWNWDNNTVTLNLSKI